MRIEYAMMRFAVMPRRSTLEKVLDFLRQLGDALRAYVAELEAYAEAALPTATLHQRLSLEHGIAVYRARLEWAESALAEIAATPG